MLPDSISLHFPEDGRKLPQLFLDAVEDLESIIETGEYYILTWCVGATRVRKESLEVAEAY